MTTLPLNGSTPPGWLPDPTGMPTLRWWDGTTWTSSLAPMPPPVGYAAQQRSGTNGMAVASFVLGLLWIWGVGAVLATIFGEIARSQLKQNPAQSGAGLALAGRIFGAIGIVATVLMILASLN